jgi:hypothetical protein
MRRSIPEVGGDEVVRAVLAIFLYGVAAVGGLAAGYYATAPGSLRERATAREEQRIYEERLRAEFDEMEAAAAFLGDLERRSADPGAQPASAGL